MITFVTIFYNDFYSINFLLQQIESFEYLNMEKNIICIYNDVLFDLNNIKKNFINNNISYDKIKFFSRIDILNKYNLIYDSKYSDYTYQQILKLLICNFIETQYYIILDDKNYFINNTDISFFFTDKPKIFYEPFIPNNYINKYYDNAIKLFNENYLNINNISYVPITPFIIITDICKKLINNYSLYKLFDYIKYFIVTEFSFYTAYLLVNNYIDLYSKEYFYVNKLTLWSININFDFTNYNNFIMFAVKKDVLKKIKNDINLHSKYINFHKSKTKLKMYNILINHEEIKK